MQMRVVASFSLLLTMAVGAGGAPVSGPLAASPPPVQLPLCTPRRMLLHADYGPLEGMRTPTAPLSGRITFAFTITRLGRVENIAIIRTTSTWKGWDEEALKVLASAGFEPPADPCRQTMVFRTTLTP